MLALSLLKRSPKSSSDIIPSSIRTHLSIPPQYRSFKTGINNHVFDALRHSVQKMSEKDRYCCLLFDEMSIRENVQFNHKFDCIEGFEDLGSRGRICNIANHALLFMVRGLHRKWKQPLAYYLSLECTNLYPPTAILTNFQKGVYYSAIKIFNNLPHEIKDLVNDILPFWNALKRFLLANSFYNSKKYFNYQRRSIVI